MAATRVGLIGTDDYLNEWHRETRPCGDDLDAEAAAEAERLELAYPDDDARHARALRRTDRGWSDS